MQSPIQITFGATVGTVNEVYADRISIVLDPEAPQATALNSGVPARFPRVNEYLLIPNEDGATIGIVSSIRIERLPMPTRRAVDGNSGLVDLPIPSRVMSLIPIATLKADSANDTLGFKLQRGMDVLPTVGDAVRLPTAEQLSAIVEGDSSTSGRILIGHCPTAGNSPILVDPDKLFGRHLAVLGNTGSGKSCSVAGLIRWSLDAAKNCQHGHSGSSNPNARFIVLDPNGEYANAFPDQDVRVFTAEVEHDQNHALRVPAWLWNGTEWAAYAEAASGVQRPVLVATLRSLRSQPHAPTAITTKSAIQIKQYLKKIRTHVADGDHLQPGKREELANALFNCSKDFHKLSEEWKSENPEFSRCLSQIATRAFKLEKAKRGDLKDGVKPSKPSDYYHRSFANCDIDPLTSALSKAGKYVGLDGSMDFEMNEDVPQPFPIKDLPDHLDAVASTWPGRDIAQFVDTMKYRIQTLLANTRLESIIGDEDSISLVEWLTDYIGGNQSKNGTIAVIDLSLVPTEVVHIVVSVLARLTLEALQWYRKINDAVLPTCLVLDEAHTFVHRSLSGENASPAGQACGRIFERIAREGRKFGLGLVMASQRPSELSPTVLSQCNTFLLHRLVNESDQELVRRLVPDGLGSLLRELPSLPTGRAIMLGWANISSSISPGSEY